MPEAAYTQALLADLEAEYTHLGASARPLTSLFFGGGTPSLFSPRALGAVIDRAESLLGFAPNVEITLEVNPGTQERADFCGLQVAGVNRLSIGAQSFNAQHLSGLGRIHSPSETRDCVAKARQAGFQRLNLDLMHGLPNQLPDDAEQDLKAALELDPEHISWYQLTIEPNTVFYTTQPPLPEDDALAAIQDQGEALLAEAGFQQYEVSAFAKAGAASRHNLNYWEFGDYIGIGAGAHGKHSHWHDGRLQVMRYRKTRLPADYLRDGGQAAIGVEPVSEARLRSEFMLNALRLAKGVDSALFEARTGLPLTAIAATWDRLAQKGLVLPSGSRLGTTPLGFRFLNDVILHFDD
jgi:putative oxygen-independent coproporphyrinogen III oxidase